MLGTTLPPFIVIDSRMFGLHGNVGTADLKIGKAGSERYCDAQGQPTVTNMVDDCGHLPLVDTYAQ
jgi:hypothetical protein